MAEGGETSDIEPPASFSGRATRWAVDAYLWLADHAPQSRHGRLFVFVVLFVLIVVPSAVLLYATFAVNREETEAWFAALGYPGVFVANLISTGTVFLPVPGLTAVAQALIISEAKLLNPFLVGFLGGLGMGLGETTAYLTGLAGSAVARESEPPVPRWLRPAFDRVVRGVGWLMRNYGLPTLFVLAVIPDPIFEFAGITAGATRIGFRKFMAVVVSGNLIRGLLLAYVGAELIPW